MKIDEIASKTRLLLSASSQANMPTYLNNNLNTATTSIYKLDKKFVNDQ